MLKASDNAILSWAPRALAHASLAGIEDGLLERFFGEEQGLIIPGAVKDMDDFNPVLNDALENQKSYEGTKGRLRMPKCS